MMKILTTIFLVIFSLATVWAQPPTSQPGIDRPLNVDELKSQKWFYSIEEAMGVDPLTVYKLSLEDQKLKQVPQELFMFKNLQMLNLNHCHIKEIPDSMGCFKRLEVLSLKDNKLRTLPKSFRELRSLEVLFLGGNKLIDIPIYIGGMGRLKRLDISRNPLTPLEVSEITRMLPKVDITY